MYKLCIYKYTHMHVYFSEKLYVYILNIFIYNINKHNIFFWNIYTCMCVCIYIQSWSKLLAPLVNMIKEGSENKPALLIILIFY